MNEETNQEEFLTAGEAARVLKITPDKLRYLRLQGRVKPAAQFKYETLYRLADLRNVDLSKRKRGPKKTDVEKP